MSQEETQKPEENLLPPLTAEELESLIKGEPIHEPPP